MGKHKLLKKYRIKYGLDKEIKKTSPKRMTTYNQYKSRSKNPKPQMDVETLNNGVSSLSYKDFLKKNVVIKKMKWKKT
jgi:hypothetical protein